MGPTSIVTLSRSDYASVGPVIRAALAVPELEVRVVAGGSHLLTRHGRTIDQIRADGLPIHEVVDFLREEDDTPTDLGRALARATAAFVDLFAARPPGQVFILGDRWEMLAVACAAAMLQLPIIHHSGGDITQGSADNQTRYALSALAHLHLVALEEHRRRLIRMGEEAWRVTTTGEPALCSLLEDIEQVPDLHARLRLNANEPFVLATFHPTTFESMPAALQADLFIAALDGLPGAIVLTAPNPDADSEVFLAKFRAYAARRPSVQLHESLGARLYHAAMSQARLMIGNSSSGLWEAPSFRLPVVNIGCRQQGRAHGENVIHAPLDLAAIAAAISRALDPTFRAGLDGRNPYVNERTLDLIVGRLRHGLSREMLLSKRLVDPLAS